MNVVNFYKNFFLKGETLLMIKIFLEGFKKLQLYFLFAGKYFFDAKVCKYFFRWKDGEVESCW